jgi:hypothetical protein
MYKNDSVNITEKKNPLDLEPELVFLQGGCDLIIEAGI